MTIPLKKILNQSEAAADRELRQIAEEYGYGVQIKMRLAGRFSDRGQRHRQRSLPARRPTERYPISAFKLVCSSPILDSRLPADSGAVQPTYQPHNMLKNWD
jgi:hypothetical protein